jgi:hypothetical protein
MYFNFFVKKIALTKFILSLTNFFVYGLVCTCHTKYTKIKGKLSRTRHMSANVEKMNSF